MKIVNTVPYFVDNFEPSVQFVKQYHEQFPEHFKEYILYHCKNAEEKIENAIQQYPSKMNEIQDSSDKIEKLIRQITNTYERKYDVEFTQDVHIIVGAYGSNAFTHRQIIPEVTFCLEKLSSDETHLKMIIAHEFGHALHNLLSDQDGIDWSKVQWFHPFTMLLQEGCATYFSEQAVEADKSVCFSFDDTGNVWMDFAEANEKRIITSFLNDLEHCSNAEIFHEWFSINGGTTFGFTRLAYYIGYRAVQRLIEKYDERKAVTLWKESSFQEEMEKVLRELVEKKGDA